MCNKFTLTRKSRFKNWLDDQAMKLPEFCIFFTELLASEFEKIVLWLVIDLVNTL